MVTKTKIDSSDLLELENKINREQQQARHQQNNTIQTIALESDELKEKVSTFSLKQEYMMKSIDDLAKNLKEHMVTEEANMKGFIKDIQQSFKDLSLEIKSEYTTKIEHNQNKKDISDISKIIQKLQDDNLKFKLDTAKVVGGATVVSIIVGFILNKIF